MFHVLQLKVYEGVLYWYLYFSYFLQYLLAFLNKRLVGNISLIPNFRFLIAIYTYSYYIYIVTTLMIDSFR